MPGSTPDADAVTASGGTWSGLTPSRLAISARRAVTCAASVLLSWARFDAPEEDGSVPPRPSLLASVPE